LKSRSDK